MKRILAVLIAVVMAVMVVPSASAADRAQLTNVRTGQHPTFDRVVFDLTGGRPGASVSRISEPTNCDFEADLSVAIGVKDPNRRVDAYFLDGPLRYVVDVYHS